MQPAQLLFVNKNPKINPQLDAQFLQKYGCTSLVQCQQQTAQSILMSFNQQLLRLCCNQIFIQNPTSFDGTSLIKKYAESQAIFLLLC